MKKFILIVLCVVLFLTSCATTQETEVNTFKTFMNETNKARHKIYSTNYSYEGLKEYVVNNSDDAKCLSGEEAKLLKKGANVKVFLTQEEFAQDIDLLFKSLRSSWGSYYYWGGNSFFDNLKQEITEQFKDSKTISRTDIDRILGEKFSFVVDGHFKMGSAKRTTSKPEYNYVYSYTEQFSFTKEENEFVFYDGEKRWIFIESPTNPNIRLEKTLFRDGTLTYAFVQFTTEALSHQTDTIILSDGSQSKEEEIVWVKSKPAYTQSQRDPAFLFSKTDGLAYIRLCSFDDSNSEWVKKLENFAKCASNAKSSKLIVFDLRSNGGGHNKYMNEWYQTFTGQSIDIKTASGRRSSHFKQFKTNDISYRYSESQGTFVYNSIPIIVLMDHNCGSSGETALNSLKTMKNVIVIGTNSSGCESFGNVVNCTLPNSEITYSFGTDIRCFSNQMENIDGKGFEPDVWADPIFEDESIVSMIRIYNLASEEAIQALSAAFATK